MAEREGFEPPELSLNGFQDRRLKPLGHLSGENPISLLCGLRGKLLFSWFYFFRTAHILPERFRDNNGSIRLLIVFQDRHDRTSHGKA